MDTTVQGKWTQLKNPTFTKSNYFCVTHKTTKEEPLFVRPPPKPGLATWTMRWGLVKGGLVESKSQVPGRAQSFTPRF